MGQMIFHTCNYGVMIISRDVPIYRYSRDFSRLFVVILNIYSIPAVTGTGAWSSSKRKKYFYATYMKTLIAVFFLTVIDLTAYENLIVKALITTMVK